MLYERHAGIQVAYRNRKIFDPYIVHYTRAVSQHSAQTSIKTYAPIIIIITHK